MSSYTNSFTILGERATIDVSDNCKHLYIRLGDLVIADQSGNVGFWEGWHSNARRSCLKGAAHTAALEKYARQFVESEIISALRVAQEMASEAV